MPTPTELKDPRLTYCENSDTNHDHCLCPKCKTKGCHRTCKRCKELKRRYGGGYLIGGITHCLKYT